MEKIWTIKNQLVISTAAANELLLSVFIVTVMMPHHAKIILIAKLMAYACGQSLCYKHKSCIDPLTATQTQISSGWTIQFGCSLFANMLSIYTCRSSLNRPVRRNNGPILTRLSPMDSSILIIKKNPFFILGVSG